MHYCKAMYESSLKHWSPAILEKIRCLPFYHFGHTVACPNVLGMWELNMSATFTRLGLMIQAVMTFYDLILLCDGPSDETCCTKARDKPCIQHTAPPPGHSPVLFVEFHGHVYLHPVNIWSIHWAGCRGWDQSLSSSICCGYVCLSNALFAIDV